MTTSARSAKSLSDLALTVSAAADRIAMSTYGNTSAELARIVTLRAASIAGDTRGLTTEGARVLLVEALADRYGIAVLDETRGSIMADLDGINAECADELEDEAPVVRYQWNRTSPTVELDVTRCAEAGQWYATEDAARESLKRMVNGGVDGAEFEYFASHALVIIPVGTSWDEADGRTVTEHLELVEFTDQD